LSDLVFPAAGGGYLQAPKVGEDSRSWFDAALRKADLPRITPHDLRHTAASLAVSVGANVKAVQRMLGHSSAAMTLDVYTDLFDDDLDAVAEALDAAVSARRSIL
jgi:integrase